MQIELGKTYKAANGQHVKIVEFDEDDDRYPFRSNNTDGDWFTAEGKFWFLDKDVPHEYRISAWDLLEEVVVESPIKKSGKVPHKHAELIKAWADGAEIQVRVNSTDKWAEAVPNWDTDYEYRIKPDTKVHYVGINNMGDIVYTSEVQQPYIMGVNQHKLETCLETKQTTFERV